MGERLVIIGGTAAGLSAASKAKRCKPELEVTVFEKSGYVSYGSCGLPYFVGGMIEKPNDLVTFTADELREKRNIPTYIHHEVTCIDRENKIVKVHNLDEDIFFEQAYDSLVIATGAVPFIPKITGIDADGVYCLRTVEDGITIKEVVRNGAKRAVIVGGGFIGLEMAEELTLSGVHVELVEALPRLLPFLCEEYSRETLEVLEKNGVTTHLATTVSEILAEKGHATAVKTADGKIIETDFVLMSVGVSPNTGLAKNCGLTLGIKGGIVVDETLQTSDPHIWACGDCVQMYQLTTGQPCYVPLGTTANKQGRIAGGNIAGEKGVFKGVLASQVTKVFDLYISSTGLTTEQANAAGYDAVSSGIVKGDRASYYTGGTNNKLTLVLDKNSGVLLGAQGIGGVSVAGRINVLAAAITAGMTVEALNELDLVYSPSVAPVYDPILIAASQALKFVKKKDV
ncbi:MAG: FAD-dependent oxidoreductase [Oscillospiraceae bacterium]